jgi:hypothetical protein
MANPATLRYVRDVALPYATDHGIELHELRKVRRDGTVETPGLQRFMKPNGVRPSPSMPRSSSRRPRVCKCPKDPPKTISELQALIAPDRRVVVTGLGAGPRRMRTSVDRPLQVGWIDPCAPRSTVCIGESYRADQSALVLFSLANKFRINSIEHQLGAAKHLEVPVGVDVAPCEVQKAIAAFAVNWRALEVK